MPITTAITDAHQAADYAEVWALREAVLRVPLGLSLRNEDLSMDFDDIIVVARNGGELIGCILLHPAINGVVKFRQMAVYPQWQGRGVGRIIMEAAEATAREAGYTQVKLHARQVVAAFYTANGYTPVGEVFEEVGIAHVLMVKEL